MTPSTPLEELHRRTGAQFGEWFGTRLPQSYGDIAAEDRFARQSVALVDTNFHLFAFLEGPDRVRYLNAVVTNNIKDLGPGQGIAALLLNPQGHILAELECFALPDRLLLLSPVMARERTIATLDKFIIMDDATLSDVTEQFGSMAIEGPQAGDLMRELSGLRIETMAERDHQETELGGISCRVIRRSQFGGIGVELIARRDSSVALWEALIAAVRKHSGGPIGYTALNCLRLEAGIPWFGADFDDKVIPQEAALETTHVSFTKGCYTGQEIVERVRSRGHVNRRRVGLEFTGGIPEAGAKLSSDGKEVGNVTSAAQLPESGRVIGMGYVRREQNAPGSRLEWEKGTAEVIDLPLR